MFVIYMQLKSVFEVKFVANFTGNFLSLFVRLINFMHIFIVHSHRHKIIEHDIAFESL